MGKYIFMFSTNTIEVLCKYKRFDGYLEELRSYIKKETFVYSNPEVLKVDFNNDSTAICVTLKKERRNISQDELITWVNTCQERIKNLKVKDLKDL